MNNVIEKIEQYLNDTQDYIDEMKCELEKKANNKSNWHDNYNIAMYYREQINYSINEHEIYCRALRDKINELQT